jgi:hypothetical protein
MTARLATPDIDDATAVRFQPEKFQETSLDSLFTGRRGSGMRRGSDLRRRRVLRSSNSAWHPPFRRFSSRINGKGPRGSTALARTRREIRAGLRRAPHEIYVAGSGFPARARSAAGGLQAARRSRREMRAMPPGRSGRPSPALHAVGVRVNFHWRRVGGLREDGS